MPTADHPQTALQGLFMLILGLSSPNRVWSEARTESVSVEGTRD